ncbi:MAG: hypothetical protein DRO01_00095 [Thermoproteota archaeon]|nr:MAG: hypothetical protein DRO01_00095 [Candidatus Korarchaeota archaeon]
MKKEKLQKLMEFEDALSDLISETLPLSELTKEEIEEFFGDKTLTEYILEVKEEVESFSGVIEE